MKKLIVALLVLALFLAFYREVAWDITGGWEGMYLLHGKHGGYEVTDDLFPEDADRYITGLPLGNFSNRHRTVSARNGQLHVLWDKRNGRGFIKNEFTDGRKLLVNLSRFKTQDGVKLSGVFIGGGLPAGDPDYSRNDKNETGMSYFDGTRWFHIWCYINEAISSLSAPDTVLGPEQWRFVDSHVIENSNREFTIQSRHIALVDGLPVEIVKYLYYLAGNSYVTLVTRVTNLGDRPFTALYMYGDEPWLGNYGSSAGNVGWTRDGLVKTEQSIDSTTHTYAGFFDYGNDLAGERHDFTMKANFIQWTRATRPDSVYYSNFIGHFSNPDINGKPVPLASTKCRFMGLQWKRKLAPRESFSFALAVGMADIDPATGFPVKPRTRFDKLGQ